MRCAVVNCSSTNNSKSCEMSFFVFPNDIKLQKQWMKFCDRDKRINPKTSCICMLHFKPEDIINSLQYEMGFAKKRLLKNGVVPSVKTVSYGNVKLHEERASRIEKREHRKLVASILQEHNNETEQLQENQEDDAEEYGDLKPMSAETCTESKPSDSKHDIPQRKCAEIFFRNDSHYSITCVFCKTSIISFRRFKKHFAKLHINEEESMITQRENRNYEEDLRDNEKDQILLNVSDPLEPVLCREDIKLEELNENSVFERLTDDDYPLDREPSILSDSPAKEAELEGQRSDAFEVDWSKPYQPSLLKALPKRPYKPRNLQNSCPYCDRTFKRRYQLDTHINIHTGSKPHQCEKCGKQFRAVSTLTRHLNTHTDRQIHSCEYCNKTFSHKAALLSHESRHRQERNVECSECGKWFYTVNQLDTHKRKVHKQNDDSTLPFICDLCNNRYRTASMLSTHKFRKHYKTAKFSCEQCSKKFVTEDNLKAHTNIHYGGRNGDRGQAIVDRVVIINSHSEKPNHAELGVLTDFLDN